MDVNGVPYISDATLHTRITTFISEYKPIVSVHYMSPEELDPQNPTDARPSQEKDVLAFAGLVYRVCVS